MSSITKKDRPLTPQHFADFEACYGIDPNGWSMRKASDSEEDRWRSFHMTDVKERDFKLDGFKWLKASTGEVSPPPPAGK
jgi:type I restriction enzyme M protein